MALFLLTNLVQMADEDRTYWGVFDLCVECVSDSTRAEIERDTITKKGEYEAVGVQEYYILDDQHQSTTFYELTASGVYQPIQAQAGIIASRVLSDFQFRIEDLYRQRPWEDLVEDQVYQHFVLPAYVAEKERANRESQRADQGCQRADEMAALAKANAFTSLRQSIAYRFNLPLDYYDDILPTLDLPTLTALNQQVFTIANQAAFDVLLRR